MQFYLIPILQDVVSLDHYAVLFSWFAILAPNFLHLGSSPAVTGPFMPSTLIDKPGVASFNPGIFSLICFSIFFTAFS